MREQDSKGLGGAAVTDPEKLIEGLD